MDLRSLLALATLATAATSAPAIAQLRLPETNVTAKGYSAQSSDTPQAVVTLTPEDAVPAAPVGELFRGQPGLAVQSDGAWGLNPVLRGLRKESIVVLVDGVRLNSAQPQGAIASMIDVGLLDRVEVVKGPSSVLHGSGALGGVVNLLTPQPRFADTAYGGGRFSLGASSVDDGLSGALLLERGGPDYGLTIGVAGRHAGDYDSPTGKIDHTGFRSDSLLARYRHRLGKEASLWINLQRHADHDVWYPGSARTGGQPGGAGIAPLLGTVTIHSPRQQRELVEIGVDARLGPGRLEASVQRQEVFRQIRAWSDRLQRDYVRNDVSFITDSVQTRYLVPLGERHLLTMGLHSARMTGDPERHIDNNPPAFDNNTRNDPFDHGVLRSTGLYLQDEFKLGPVRLMAGLRGDRVTGDARSKGAGPATVTEGLRHRDDTLSWSLGAIWSVSPSIDPYVNLSRGWRASDMRERFEDAARGDGYYHIGNPQLRPERATAIEIGIKAQPPWGQWQLAAFHTRIDDYIAGRITGGVHPGTGLPIKQMENLDEVVLHGVEGSLRMPLGGWLADAGFTWLRGRNHQDDEPLYQMPPPELRLGIGQPAERGFHWRAQWRAVAAQDRIATRFSNGSENATPGFATVDLTLGWKLGALGSLRDAEIVARLGNLFDRAYHEHLVEGISGLEIAAPGRSLALTFKGQF